MMEFSSDCCQCILLIHRDGDQFVLDDWIQKCEKHKNINENALLKVVLTHNNNFNRKVNSRAERDQQKLDKRNEFNSIRNSGAGVRK